METGGGGEEVVDSVDVMEGEIEFMVCAGDVASPNREVGVRRDCKDGVRGEVSSVEDVISGLDCLEGRAGRVGRLVDMIDEEEGVEGWGRGSEGGGGGGGASSSSSKS